MDMVAQFDVYLVAFDPTLGSEIKKTRPCIIVSPNEMNRHLNTVIIAPLTSTIKNYPTRVNLTFQEKHGQVVLDQIRTVDNRRLVKKLGIISGKTKLSISKLLIEMFEH
jgi:mRNA interferase MazF